MNNIISTISHKNIFAKTVLFLFLSLILFSTNSFSQEKDIVFETSEDGRLDNGGREILSFSTLGFDNATYTCSASSIGSKAKYALRLQYRTGKDEKWKDYIDSKGRRVEHVNLKKRYSKTYKIHITEELLNKDNIELSWYVIKIKTKGKYPQFSITNNKISGFFDRFNGKKTEISYLFKNENEFLPLINNQIEFDHIPLPYTYAQVKKLKFQAKYLRGDIILKLIGRDTSQFGIDERNFYIDSLDSKIISISYNPNKVGRHNAKLIVTTKNSSDNIIIDLNGSCSKLHEMNTNFLDENITYLRDKTIYRIPVFSNSEYQFKFDYNKSELLDKNISITYEWYKNTQLLYDMTDRVSGLEEDTTLKKELEPELEAQKYCVPLTSPKRANYLQISINTNGDELDISDLYFGTPRLKSLVESGNWADPNIWLPRGTPNIEDFVYISPNLNVKVNDDVYCSMLVLGDSSNVDIASGKMFYISGDIIYGKGSWFIVHQDLLPKKWSYTSSPVNDTKALIYSMRKNDNETWLMEYKTGVKSKLNDFWSEYIVDPNYKLIPGKGYAVFSNQPLDVIYEGMLCKSQVSFPLVYTEQDSWNLVGNPYTAPLSSKKLFEDIDGKIQGNVLFMLDSENDVYNPIIIDGKEDVVIPSLQGFFVEALKTNSEMIFKRSQQYIPRSANFSWNNHNYLTLNISNGSRSQYVLMGMVPSADYGFDKYDAHKLFGSSKETPELYFLKDTQELAVNVFPDYPAIYDLGYYVGQESKLEISLGNLSVLPENVQVFLEDKQENKFFSLCSEKYIKFESPVGSIDDRFRIHLIKGLSIPEIKSEYSGIYLWSHNNKIYAFGDNYHPLTSIRVYDKSNLLVLEQKYNKGVTPLEYDFEQGLYSIDLEIGGRWIEGFIVRVK